MMELNSNQIAELLPHRYPFARGAGAVGQGHQGRQRQ